MEPMPQTIVIFLASSAELKDDREKFEQFIDRKNKILVERDRFIKLVIWEDFIDAMSKTRLQDEYDKAVRESDIFVMLFATKVGPYSREEFEAAFGQFQESNKPRIYTYFKTAQVTLSDIPREDIQSLWDFQDRLKALGHYWTEYDNSDKLINQFNGQLEKLNLFSEDIPSPPQEAIIKKYWQQLIQDPDSKRERQPLENLYIRLQVTAQGDKTSIAERFLHKRKGDPGCLDEFVFHDLPPDVAINQFHRLVVLGTPGMGKTTMFRYIAYTVSRLGLGLARTGEFSLAKKGNLVPLYLPLTKLTGYDGDLINCLKKYFETRFSSCKTLISELDCLLKNGQCLLLLDSLDEVATDKLSQVYDKIKGFMNSLDWQANIVLLSCREGHWVRDDVSLDFPAVLQIKDLDDQAIGEYLLHWFGVAQSQKASALKDKISKKPQLKFLATNPFLLSLIAWLSQSKKLPERRVELYKNCTDALLNEEHRPKDERRPSLFGPDHADLKARVLNEAAFVMMKRNKREIPRNELREIFRNALGFQDQTDERPGRLINEIHEHSSILRETNQERIYEFQHNTFREYYAARKIAAGLALYPDNVKIEPSVTDLLQWTKDPQWTEVYRLTVGLLANPTPVLEVLFDTDATLGARCYLDAHPERVDHGMIGKRWACIDQRQRLRIIATVQNRWSTASDQAKEARDAIDFIRFIFQIPETDNEVLYHCDKLLLVIGSDEAEQLSRQMFDHWPKERQYQTCAEEFKWDPFWQSVEIPVKEFRMGGGEYADEIPYHSVKLAPFRLSCYPVTVGQYHRFDPGHRKERLQDEFGKDERQPVVQINWYDAYIFCKWAHGRLPTEAEWQYACGDTRSFITTNQANFNGKIGKTTLVGSYKPNEWGLYDMQGNVWEWCQDWYDGKYYIKCNNQGIIDNPPGPATGSNRVLRGGCWQDLGRHCRSSSRHWGSPGSRDLNVGFRLVFVT
jgi:formylglycine-generating enzyme required for sulfatase activity